MEFGGFGKNSGPSAQPPPQIPFVNFPRPSPPRSVSPRSPVDYSDLDASGGRPSPILASSRPFPGPHRNNGPPLRQGDVRTMPFNDRGPQTYQRPHTILPQVAPNDSRTWIPAKAAEVPHSGRTNLPYSQSPDKISKNSRSFVENPLDLPSSSQSYIVPQRGRSPPLVSQNNLYVSGHHPRKEEFQQRPFSSPMWGNQSKSSNNINITPPTQERIPQVSATGGIYQSRPVFHTEHADGPFPRQKRSPMPSVSGVSQEHIASHPDVNKRSLIQYSDLDASEAMPSPPFAFESSFSSRDSSRPFAGIQKPLPSSNMWADQPKSPFNNASQLVREDMSPALTTRGTYESGMAIQTKHTDAPLQKRTRSPPSTNGGFQQNPVIASDGHKRAPGFRSENQSTVSGQTNSVEADLDKQHLPAVKRIKIPLSSSGQVFQENLDPAQEIERESHAKAKRLARFKDELNQPESTVGIQKVAAKRQLPSTSERDKFSEDQTMGVIGDSAGKNVSSDYEGMTSSSSIVGICPDMCPESERAERERKGDLDQYERVDGDRNLTSENLAVKKYTRTAEREAELIRPMPILQKTMEYLLYLLDEPYDDRFLGLYNFLWDRMRAIRMDLRMQHIFNLEAIGMLEQMIRLHIIAMHELCEYTKGEGFSEGFDAHLNIEQMNKTSVELFQLYDDHRKRGIHVPSEREFRGYYALLKLDKHPGYKVEPAELSLDLAKMTPEVRQTPEVLLARDVARACRTGNFIAFFRLARKATYLQACLMHAHFSKLRTQALASLHSGLQSNQGIPISQVAKWLGMEEEGMGDLLEYYGFSVKDFEEPYMVKENAFINVDNDFPVKRSKLVNRKKSRVVASDVSFPSLAELHASEELKDVQLKKYPDPITTPLQSLVPVSSTQPRDEEMNGLGTIFSPKASRQNSMDKKPTVLNTLNQKMVEHEARVAPASPLVLDLSNNFPEQSGPESVRKPKYDSVFRNSFGRSNSIKHDLQQTGPINLEVAQENKYADMPLESVVHTPITQPMVSEDLEDEESIGIMEEDTSYEVAASYYDKEVADAKLKLIIRIWKRRTTKKRELRERKQFAANAALSSLSMGPPVWRVEVQSGTLDTFNIDHIMSERHEIQERSWSALNPSDVVAAKLIDKNPDAKFLCWKMVLCSQEETPQENESALTAAASWLHSKLIPTSNDSDGNLLESSPGLSIWRSWIPDQSSVDLICCLSVIKSITVEDSSKSVAGASGVLFLLSEYIPIEIQKKRLHDLVMSLPANSSLPLLILSGSRKDEVDPSNIANVLGLRDTDKSRVTTFFITSLKDGDLIELDGFFSDKRLREGLEWLASESQPQLVVRETKTRELVLSHLNPTMEILDGMDTQVVGPNNCISAFNEALDRAMIEVAAAARANPIGWPCPEINLLQESSDEYRAAIWYLPNIGWSSSSRTETLMSAFNNLKLPAFGGFDIGSDIESQKSRLEHFLIDYLSDSSQIMGVALAQKEAGIMLQKFTQLELRDTTYRIIPKWVSIFRRIFSWRLSNLTSGEVSSTYVLVSSDEEHNSESRVITTFVPTYIVSPSLDELLEVGQSDSSHTEYETYMPRPAMASNGVDFPTYHGNAMLMENENKSSEDRMLTSCDSLIRGEENEVGGQMVQAAKVTDKLSELLEKCNIVQNLIDNKLSLYF